MCSVREHFEHVPIVHSLNIVNAFILLVHSLVIINIYIRLPITVNTAVLYYSATLWSICTAESDRNTQNSAQLLTKLTDYARN